MAFNYHRSYNPPSSSNQDHRKLMRKKPGRIARKRNLGNGNHKKWEGFRLR